MLLLGLAALTLLAATRPHLTPRPGVRAAAPSACAAVQPTLTFRKNDPPEAAVPSVSLTKSRDGTTGTATFRFDSASVLELDNVWDKGLLTGLWISDTEGVLHTTDVSVVFTRGLPVQVVAILVLKSVEEWQRFLRFMKRYAVANELEFESAPSATGGAAFKGVSPAADGADDG